MTAVSEGAFLNLCDVGGNDVFGIRTLGRVRDERLSVPAEQHTVHAFEVLIFRRDENFLQMV